MTYLHGKVRRFELDERQRRRVRAMLAAGELLKDIAASVGVDSDVLRGACDRAGIALPAIRPRKSRKRSTTA